MPDEADHVAEDLVEGFVEGFAGLFPGGSLVGVGLRRLTRAVVAEQRRNRSRALSAAELMSGLSREDLAETIANNPRLVPLLTPALYVSAMTGRSQAPRFRASLRSHLNQRR